MLPGSACVPDSLLTVKLTWDFRSLGMSQLKPVSADGREQRKSSTVDLGWNTGDTSHLFNTHTHTPKSESETRALTCDPFVYEHLCQLYFHFCLAVYRAACDDETRDAEEKEERTREREQVETEQWKQRPKAYQCMETFYYSFIPECD